ncbi:OLC1v1012660C1 [Oldenlandia corymbosa var. corymbosa]|uniref:OLC1v1012660C1 n=1 Tax=Oldenlandia corymbosa var. corymbosa TaxID=529605 RepID=A0AAV1DWH4_OLDCO|nr:OLC1v1012660C1 [Oldenlandia corymbosa var. corymbosa]
MGGFWNQAVALFIKNLIYHKRHLRSNLRLILFPVALFLLLGGLRYYLNHQDKDKEPLGEKEPTALTPLLQISPPEFRASQDLPNQSCRNNNGACPVTVLVTGNNRTFVEGVAGNLFTNFTTGPNASADGVFVEEEHQTSKGSYYYIQSQCTKNFSIRISIQDREQDALCLQGVHLWRTDFKQINNEIFKGYYNGNPQGEINEILTAYDFQDSSLTNFDVIVWYNNSKTQYAFGNPIKLGSTASAMNMVWNAFLKVLLRRPVKMTLEFIGEMPTPQGLGRSLDMASTIGALFYPWVILQLFPVVLTSLVYEKQQKLTIMMKMHGLGDAPYWVITYLYFLIICSLYMLCFLAFGYAAGLVFFTLNSISIQLLFYFLHINLLISSAFLLGNLFSNVKTASVVGFILVFGSWILGRTLFNRLIEDTSFPRSWLIVLELFPGLSLYRGLYDFDQCSQHGFDMGAYASGGCHCLLQISRKSTSSFDNRSQNQESRIQILLDKQDIDQETEKVEQLLSEPNSGYPIISDKLRKTYPSQDGNPEKHAVKGLSLAVAHGECFGLLGPNGAGKTSSISMLTGLTEPSSGTAFIGGLDLRTQMSAIYASMGVCPQHDLLWDTLTGREHLNFYGRLKNLTGANLSKAVNDSLAKVNLLRGDADKLVKKYSGGMKRRLSIAISLIGDPKVVYLDEPSTGLDPASRNLLWDAVSQAKQNRAIILTTHSMEEAEHLCDRIGIFVDGSLQCLGSPDELKHRYGGTYIFTMATLSQNEKDVEDLVKHLSPNAKRTYHLSGTQKFEIPKADVKLSVVFLAVKVARERFTVKAWEIADTTMEDVFIKVAKETPLST